MSVFLLILKIIGIALLVILGLIVVIALLALFCPFVYRVKGCLLYTSDAADEL